MTMKIFSENKNCNCCSNKVFEEIFKINNMPLRTANNFSNKNIKNHKKISLTFLFCKKCKNMQLKENVNPQILYNNFSYKTSSSLGLVKHFNLLAKKKFKDLNIKKDDLIIDIGSNDGSFLEYFKKKGAKVLGIEPSKKISLVANRKGIKTLCKYFNKKSSMEIKKEYGNARLISCFNTFANIENIQNFLIGFKNIMSHKTVGIIETQYGLDVIKKSLIDTIYHEHINYFTKKSLNILFQKNGLEIFKFNVFGNKGGSLRIFFRLMKNKTITKQNVQKELDAESKKINLKEIRNFKKKINENKRSLKSFLLSQKFHKISGFGASVGTSTLIRFFELENFIDVIYDDNPQVDYLNFGIKKIKVLNSKKMYNQNRNKLIILFAYRYLKNIKKTHENFTKKNGIFLSPLPKFKLHQ